MDRGKNVMMFVNGPHQEASIEIDLPPPCVFELQDTAYEVYRATAIGAVRFFFARTTVVADRHYPLVKFHHFAYATTPEEAVERFRKSFEAMTAAAIGAGGAFEDLCEALTVLDGTAYAEREIFITTGARQQAASFLFEMWQRFEEERTKP